MTLTVVKQGQEIEFETSFESLQSAKEYLAEFMSYNSFVLSLLSKRKLSDKQEAWVHYLATDHQAEANKPEDEVVNGEYISLVEKMYAGVKSPGRKFTVRIPGLIIQTITKGVNQGGLYLFDDNNQYFGKITRNGELVASYQDEDVLNILEDAQENLLKLAQLYGHETGNCSICGRTLSDAKSIQLGIGPICLKRLC